MYFCIINQGVMNAFNDFIFAAVDTLLRGGTLLYPTDTIWGIGCDATNYAAVEKLYSLKQRDHGKSMLVLCADEEMVERYVAPVGDSVRELLSAESPTTVIMPQMRGMLASNLVASDGTIGVRIPRMDFCQSMLASFGRPDVSTSANLSGCPSPSSFADIDSAIVGGVEYCVPSSYDSGSARSSRIVKLLPDGAVQVIRE